MEKIILIKNAQYEKAVKLISELLIKYRSEIEALELHDKETENWHNTMILFRFWTIYKYENTFVFENKDK